MGRGLDFFLYGWSIVGFGDWGGGVAENVINASDIRKHTKNVSLHRDIIIYCIYICLFICITIFHVFYYYYYYYLDTMFRNENRLLFIRKIFITLISGLLIEFTTATTTTKTNHNRDYNHYCCYYYYCVHAARVPMTFSVHII